jgi:hypothetical protein
MFTEREKIYEQKKDLRRERKKRKRKDILTKERHRRREIKKIRIQRARKGSTKTET